MPGLLAFVAQLVDFFVYQVLPSPPTLVLTHTSYLASRPTFIDINYT